MEIAGAGSSLEGEFIGIEQPTDAAEARRLASRRASALSFGESESGRLALVVTEIAKNLIKHAAGGDIFLRTLRDHEAVGVEVLALDRGPGMGDVGRSFQDGYSTAGTQGTGLGAIARLSSNCDIYSRPGQGTVLMAQVWKGTLPARIAPFRAGAVTHPVAGETCCGDGWIVQERPSGARLLMADGLGHGPQAAAAAEIAIEVAREHPGEGPAALLERAHAALRPTRGAAVAVAEVDCGSGAVRFAGIGNIGSVIVPHAGEWQRMVSHPGTIGQEMRKIVEFSYRWSPGALLLMHSDGLTSSWALDPYPGLVARHPAVVAGVLYRDFTRGRDDVAVLALSVGAPA